MEVDEQTERPTGNGEEAGEDQCRREKPAGKHSGRPSSRGAGPSETLTATGLSQGSGGMSLLKPRMFGIWGPAN